MAIRVTRRLTGVEISPEMLRSGEANEIFASISPTSFIDKNTPPTLLMQGEKDTVVPPANADALVEKFTVFGIPFDNIRLENSDHSLLQNSIKHLKFYGMLFEYCKRYFGK